MIIIGEKINGSIPAVADAIAKRDAEFIKNRAKIQAEAGATFIDCCASVPEAEEVETLKWMIDCIQEVTDLPISVDSPSPDVLLQVFPYCKRPPMKVISFPYSFTSFGRSFTDIQPCHTSMPISIMDGTRVALKLSL